ncbi:HK97-gp10 family putative phage morphogenesis protein [Variovorax sp. EBFNA2]|uniref:HK97-gp10 family putative phage morphogenesis protein n=1 Tax=Variovorax sp. EBFNA2 TaxID=3342097 RepID=UPI0029C016B2|nr:HK97-gp10 family putative phage morphogenesis protein [Variovorax boronicumulans]WPG35135.1 hypothetical protein RZE79_16720 [Variovorax boronicumulans]
MADTETMKGLDGVLAKLKSLPPAVVSQRGGPVKTALRKGGVVIQKAAQSQIRRVTQNTEEAGYESTLTLEKAVVVRRDPNPQRSGANERYRVLVSRKKYDGRDTKAIATGRYLEIGTEQQPAEPWMTPAYMSARQKALDTTVSELGKGIDRIVKKLEQGGK